MQEVTQPNQNFHLFIRGNPVPQGRPKFFRRDNFVGAYDPKKSKSWKEIIYYRAMAGGAQVQEGPLYLILHFKLQKPKTLSKTVQHHVKRPDLDNLIKAVKDGLKGVCYKDDCQIIRIAATKEYGDNPGVDIQIMKVGCEEKF